MSLKVLSTSLMLLSVHVVASCINQPDWKHSLSAMDSPIYAADFTHFNHVNPAAPKQGHIHLPVHGTFDTLNPYTIKGIPPSRAPSTIHFGFLELNEPLMVGTGLYAPSMDQINTAYGLIAEAVAWCEESGRLSFRLNSAAYFHNGVPITADDVLFSYGILKTEGTLRYKQLLEQVIDVSVESSHIIHFYLKPDSSRSLPLKISELPVLPKHYWQKRDFSKTTLEPPLLSGPYKIVAVKPGFMIRYERQENYWGKNLPVDKGLYNFDSITLEFFRDRLSAFESFKSGNTDVYDEVEAKNWSTGYDFPAIQSGEVRQIQHKYHQPTSRRFFIFNLRQERFQDRRVREAISTMFDWEWASRVIFYNAYRRTTSYFPHFTHDQEGTLPGSDELELLAPYKTQIPAEVFTHSFKLTRACGDGNIQELKSRAFQLLKSAGCHYANGKLIDPQGKPFQFEFLHHSKTFDRFVLAYSKNLAAIGIKMDFRAIDLSQYVARIRNKDFDMVQQTFHAAYIPGEYLKNYLHSDFADLDETKNFAGIKNSAVDYLVEKVIAADNKQELQTAARALDRVLLWEHYGIPNWHGDLFRVAAKKKLVHPVPLPPYSIRLTSWWLSE